MQPRPPESASDVRHGPRPVERGEHADPIHHEQRRRAVGGAEAHRRGEAGPRGPAVERGEVIDRRLVGHEDETRLGPARANPRECLEQDRLIRRPGGAGHERRRAASEPEQRLVGRHRRHPGGHAVEARIAEDADPLRRHAEAREPLRVRLRDGPRRRDGRVAGVGAARAPASGAGRSRRSRSRPPAPPWHRWKRPGWRARARDRASRTRGGRGRARRAAGRPLRGGRRAGSRPRRRRGGGRAARPMG